MARDPRTPPAELERLAASFPVEVAGNGASPLGTLARCVKVCGRGKLGDTLDALAGNTTFVSSLLVGDDAACQIVVEAAREYVAACRSFVGSDWDYPIVKLPPGAREAVADLGQRLSPSSIGVDYWMAHPPGDVLTELAADMAYEASGVRFVNRLPLPMQMRVRAAGVVAAHALASAASPGDRLVVDAPAWRRLCSELGGLRIRGYSENGRRRGRW